MYTSSSDSIIMIHYFPWKKIPICIENWKPFLGSSFCHTIITYWVFLRTSRQLPHWSESRWKSTFSSSFIHFWVQSKLIIQSSNPCLYSYAGFSKDQRIIWITNYINQTKLLPYTQYSMIAYKSIGQTDVYLKLSDFGLMKTNHYSLQKIIIAVFSPLRCFGTQNRHFQSCN